MVEVKNLVKSYGEQKAVKNISFKVEEGEILGFLGPNGAGKSTTMNIITGYLSSTSGTVTIDGCEILEDPIGAKSKLGYLPELPPLYMDMTVTKYLGFMYDLKGVKLPKKAHITDICRLAKIYDVKDRLIKNLSKGYRQRVGIAQALLGNPPVLILDEPTVGLDPKQIIEIRSLIKSLGKKHTVILSSHVLSEIQATCDRVVIISQGEVVADSKIDDLSTTVTGNNRVLLHVCGNEVAISSALKNINGVLKVDRIRSVGSDCTEFIIKAQPDKDIRKNIFKVMAENNYPIILMKSAELSLEEAFLKLTSGEIQGNKAGGRK